MDGWDGMGLLGHIGDNLMLATRVGEIGYAWIDIDGYR